MTDKQFEIHTTELYKRYPDAEANIGWAVDETGISSKIYNHGIVFGTTFAGDDIYHSSEIL